MKRLLIAALSVVGCSGPPARKPPPLLDAVLETFAPSKVPLGQAVGAALQLDSGNEAASSLRRAADLDRLASLHVALVRRDFLWSQLEPQPGQFDFTGEDAAVDDSVARGVATIGILAYNVAWAAPGGDEHAPPDPDRYAAFVEAVARHFAGRVGAWELWNEENLGFRFWVPNEDPAAYARLLAKAYPAVKRGDPRATVVFGGLNSLGAASTAEEFLADAYWERPDLGRFYDALGLHPYPVYPPHTPPEATVGRDYPLGLKLARMRAELDWFGDGQKPIWVTEVGWPVVQGQVDEGSQARWLERGAIESLAAGADRVCFYTLDDGPHPLVQPPEDAFGVFRNDGSAKPAAAALTALLGLDPTAVLTGSVGDATRSYHFKGAQRAFSASFSTDGASDVLLSPE